MDRSFLLTFGILALLIISAQIFNHLRCQSSTATPTDKKVKIIIASWWKILLFFFFSFWGARYTLVPIFFLATLYAIREYIQVSALKDVRLPLIAGGVIGTSLHYSALLLENETLFFISIHLYVLLVVMPFIVFTQRLHRLAELIAFYLGVMLLAVFLSFPAGILVFESDWIGSEEKARMAVLLLIVLTELNDILQFLCGKLFGRKKIVPWISPNKTEAGFIGGALLSTLLGAILWPNFLPITVGQAATLGFLVAIGGMLGDLVCSGVKRYRGVKDFSELLPGHGGILDRLDSLLVTAPILFFFLYYLKRG